MPCPIRQIHDASDIGTTHRQRCRAQLPLPPICKGHVAIAIPYCSAANNYTPVQPERLSLICPLAVGGEADMAIAMRNVRL
jgi:hypothetical protein